MITRGTRAFSIPIELLAKVDLAAVKNYTTASYIVTTALKEYFDSQETEREKAESN